VHRATVLDRHEGDVKIDAAQGRGAVVEFWLPDAPSRLAQA
jgi:signal transduction histidine kinase